MQLITVPAYGLPNPVAQGKMARGWNARLADPVFAEFKTEYDIAVNEMKAARLKSSGAGRVRRGGIRRGNDIALKAARDEDQSR